jgi:hypothetical protein
MAASDVAGLSVGREAERGDGSSPRALRPRGRRALVYATLAVLEEARPLIGDVCLEVAVARAIDQGDRLSRQPIDGVELRPGERFVRPLDQPSGWVAVVRRGAGRSWGSSGLFAELWQRAQSGELEAAQAHRATTAEANPTIDSAFLAAEERRDPESFKSEYLAEFVGSGGAFFDPDNITAAVTLPGELRPEDGVGWVAGLDPAFSQDLFALVLVGRDPRNPRRLLVGQVRSWLPPRRKVDSLDEGREIEDAVLAEVAQVLRLFDARAVTDQYKSAGVVERLRRYGITVRAEAMTAPVKDSCFGFLRGRLNDGSIELYEHPELLRELRAVRTRYAAGRSSVVLPRLGHSHCDHAQATALAVYEHDRSGLSRSKGRFSVPRGRAPIPAGMPGEDPIDVLNGLLRGRL